MSGSAPLRERSVATEGWGELTLDRLLAQMPAELELVTSWAGAAAPPLRWVATSELEDPTPFLLGGELLLTAGVPLAGRSPAEVAAYVARLAAAGVTALGLGVSPVHDALPAGLAPACAQHGLPLVRVAEHTPFVAVTRRFAAVLEAENDRVARHLVQANRRMLRAVLSGAPESSLLEVLAAEVRAWAVLTGADGRISASAGRPALDEEQLRPLQEKIFAGSGPRVEVASFAEPGAAVVVGHPLRSERDVNLGTLVLGAPAAFTPAQHTAVSVAVGLLEVLLRQRTVGNLAPSRLATALLLGAGEPGGERAVLRALAQSVAGPEGEPVRVVQGVRGPGHDGPWPPRAPDELPELLQLRRLFDTRLVELTAYGFVTVTRSPVPGRLLADLELRGWLVAVGRPAELPGLRAGHEEVSALRRRLRAGGRSLRAEDVPWSVAGLLGPESGRLVADRLLAPLEQLPEQRRELLLGTLRCWLDAHGNWDACSRRLGLHRNSVRRHVQQVAELLGVDLDDARVRAELLIALQFVPGAP
ncbi:helix-turn-helix domain-containing protein [Kocuria turfanensis]|uniref:PucR family transcriptional regulator n=1 Tax=Kocuria turfanensis TaxID=388357 RepID=A0A512IGL8_9MICC|nr:PucR family transcriptional regulator [Kocuria turfanensis]GEO96800.1 PucR family transcriptional regulator [Kocuria turfanensis]